MDPVITSQTTAQTSRKVAKNQAVPFFLPIFGGAPEERRRRRAEKRSSVSSLLPQGFQVL